MIRLCAAVTYRPAVLRPLPFSHVPLTSCSCAHLQGRLQGMNLWVLGRQLQPGREWLLLSAAAATVWLTARALCPSKQAKEGGRNVLCRLQPCLLPVCFNRSCIARMAPTRACYYGNRRLTDWQTRMGLETTSMTCKRLCCNSFIVGLAVSKLLVSTG